MTIFLVKIVDVIKTQKLNQGEDKYYGEVDEGFRRQWKHWICRTPEKDLSIC